MGKDRATWRRWIGVGAVVVILSIIALGHRGYTAGPRIRPIPFEEYVEATACLMQGCEGARTWLAFALINGLGNLVVFMPLGAALEHALRDGIVPALRRIGVTALLGALLSIIYEIIQLLIPGRVTAIDDVIVNAAGTAIGAVLVVALHSSRPLQAQNVA
jgi:glycopeptide antibiotics resistance protein